MLEAQQLLVVQSLLPSFGLRVHMILRQVLSLRATWVLALLVSLGEKRLVPTVLVCNPRYIPVLIKKDSIQFPFEGGRDKATVPPLLRPVDQFLNYLFF